jgi:hypothetical protein
VRLLRNESLHRPALDAPVIVEDHTWCSISSVWFKVWVRGDDPINIHSDDSNLVADGVTSSFYLKIRV